LFPNQLVVQLRQELEGRILDDICWPGRRSVDLAPLCGRQIVAVRLLTGRVQQVSVQLECPAFRDEPQGFRFRADGVRGVRGYKAANNTWALHLELEAGTATFVHVPVECRRAYVIDVLSEAETAAVRWAVEENGGQLPQAALAQFLGLAPLQAREMGFTWMRCGLLESAGGSGRRRVVSERALALAGLS